MLLIRWQEDLDETEDNRVDGIANDWNYDDAAIRSGVVVGQVGGVFLYIFRSVLIHSVLERLIDIRRLYTSGPGDGQADGDRIVHVIVFDGGGDGGRGCFLNVAPVGGGTGIYSV